MRGAARRQAGRKMASNLERVFAKLQFGTKQRVRVYRKLNRFLSNGVKLSEALDIMYGHASEDGRKPSNPLAIVLDDWRRQVRNGKGFGRAIQGWVPDSDRLVIEGGEAAGNLSVSIERAVMISGSSKKIRNTLIGGLAYPVLLFVVAIGFLVMFGTQVVPAFEEIMPREQWTGAGAQMAMMSDFVNNYLHWTLLALAGLVGLIVYSLPRWTGPRRTRFDRYAPWSIYRLIVGSGFLVTVSGMVKAGIPIPQILQMLQRGASPWYRERLQRALYFVNEGNNLGEALHKAGYGFPDKESVQDLRAYAGLNKFDETLDKLGTEWLEDSVARIEAQTGVLRNVSFILLGAVFAWIASGIFSLQQQITSSL